MSIKDVWNSIVDAYNKGQEAARNIPSAAFKPDRSSTEDKPDSGKSPTTTASQATIDTPWYGDSGISPVSGNDPFSIDSDRYGAGYWNQYYGKDASAINADDYLEYTYGKDYTGIEPEIKAKYLNDLIDASHMYDTQKKKYDKSYSGLDKALRKAKYEGGLNEYAEAAAAQLYGGGTGTEKYDKWYNDVYSDDFLSADEITAVMNDLGGQRKELEHGGGYESMTGDFDWTVYDSPEWQQAMDSMEEAEAGYLTAGDDLAKLLTGDLTGYTLENGEVSSPYSAVMTARDIDPYYEYDTDTPLSLKNAIWTSMQVDDTDYWDRDDVKAALLYAGAQYDEDADAWDLRDMDMNKYINKQSKEDFRDFTNLPTILDDIYANNTWMIDSEGNWVPVDVTNEQSFDNWWDYTTGVNLPREFYNSNEDIIKSVIGYGNEAENDWWRWATGWDRRLGEMTGDGALLYNWYMPDQDIVDELFGSGDIADRFHWDSSIDSYDDLLTEERVAELAELEAMYGAAAMDFMGAPRLMPESDYEKLAFADNGAVTDTSITADDVYDYLKRNGY